MLSRANLQTLPLRDHHDRWPEASPIGDFRCNLAAGLMGIDAACQCVRRDAPYVDQLPVSKTKLQEASRS